MEFLMDMGATRSITFPGFFSQTSNLLASMHSQLSPGCFTIPAPIPNLKYTPGEYKLIPFLSYLFALPNYLERTL